ncbi:hypothetical protein FD755_005367, partial [Muntiacus reevesi]
SPFWILSIPSEDISIFELWGHGKCLEELYSFLKSYSTCKIKIHTFNKTFTQEEKKPQHVFSILEDYGQDPNHIPENPHNIYFDGLLIASAHFGAYVYGTDIDYNTVHGLGKASRKNQKWRGPDENFRANLHQYGLKKYHLDVLVSDASKPSWKKGTCFETIITDPPYSIRESTRRTEKCPESHVPVSLSYHLCGMFFDLLKFSAETLVLGGRLIYWCSITVEKVKEFENRDQYSHLLSNHFLLYPGHNSFCETISVG